MGKAFFLQWTSNVEYEYDDDDDGHTPLQVLEVTVSEDLEQLKARTLPTVVLEASTPRSRLWQVYCVTVLILRKG